MRRVDAIGAAQRPRYHDPQLPVCRNEEIKLDQLEWDREFEYSKLLAKLHLLWKDKMKNASKNSTLVEALKSEQKDRKYAIFTVYHDKLLYPEKNGPS